MRRRRWGALLALVFAVTMVAGPVAADDFAGSEREKTKLDCPKKGESVPENQSKPKGKQCTKKKNGKKRKKYKGYQWTNDVKCADPQADLQVAKLYATGGPTDGGVGVCNDTDTVPIQGRIVFQGSADGLTLYADGDKDNSPDQAQGWIRFDVGDSGPQMRCGNAEGKFDASEPGDKDSSADCG